MHRSVPRPIHRPAFRTAKCSVLGAVFAAALFWSCSDGEGTPGPGPGLGPGQKQDTLPAVFACSGKKTCSQMVSCEEAVYYLENCPDVEIDGDGDGIPCESQWCGH